MKRTILAVALATVTAGSIAATEYLNQAGESEIDNVVQTQISDADDSGKPSEENRQHNYPQLG